LYFIYFNFFTWEGAAMFATFIETMNKDSYRIEIKEIYHDNKRNDYQIEPVIKSEDEEKEVAYVSCKHFGPAKLCEKKEEEKKGEEKKEEPIENEDRQD
jgi:hypothetical protein